MAQWFSIQASHFIGAWLGEGVNLRNDNQGSALNELSNGQLRHESTPLSKQEVLLTVVS